MGPHYLLFFIIVDTTHDLLIMHACDTSTCHDLLQSSEDGKSSKKKKAKKDPNAPKKPLTPYMLWLQETRPSLKKKYPGLSIIELSKKAGEVWKGISDKPVSWCGLNRKGIHECD